MENDAKMNPAGDSLGADNADILAAKRQRTAAASEARNRAASSAVSAGQLRAQMNAAHPMAGNGSSPASARSTTPAAKSSPVRPAASTPRRVKPQPARTSSSGTATPVKAIPAVRAVRPAQPSRPAATPPEKVGGASAAPVRTSTAAQRPTQATGGAIRPAANPAAKPAGSAQTPVRRPAQPQQRVPSAESDARTAQIPTVRAASPVRPNTSGVQNLIPHQTVSPQKNVSTEGETRITDMHAVRAGVVPADATRISQVQPVIVKKPKEEDIEDESEGKNTIISLIKAITYIVSVIVVSVFLAVFIVLVGNDIYAFVKDEVTVEVTVPESATLDDIALILHENGVIEYPTIFKLYAQFNKDDGTFLAGNYPLSPMMNYDELLAAFKPKKPTGTSRITIPEGYTTDQIIDLFVSKGIGTREGYIDVINNYDFDYWFIDDLEENGWSEERYYRLDGYLFPDTYEFYNASSEVVVINKLLRRFNDIFVESYAQKAADLGYTVDEIITIASMVEKEGGTQAHFFDISSVFNNRLKNAAAYPYLESDATVVYAIEHETGEHIVPTKEDMKYESLYNTYTNPGLPPGPIANPSASAIRAALYPSDTDYYFFVSASSTVTYYASTIDEHEANIQKINESAQR